MNVYDILINNKKNKQTNENELKYWLNTRMNVGVKRKQASR